MKTTAAKEAGRIRFEEMAEAICEKHAKQKRKSSRILLTKETKGKIDNLLYEYKRAGTSERCNYIKDIIYGYINQLYSAADNTI